MSKKGANSRKVSDISLAEQVNILFEMVRRPDGKPYTSLEVCDRINIGNSTMSQLRNGLSMNPNLVTLRKICDFFKVQLNYFDCRTSEECLAYLKKYKPQEWETPQITVLLKSQGLSEKSVNYVLDTISHLQDLESQVKDFSAAVQ